MNVLKLTAAALVASVAFAGAAAARDQIQIEAGKGLLTVRIYIEHADAAGKESACLP